MMWSRTSTANIGYLRGSTTLGRGIGDELAKDVALRGENTGESNWKLVKLDRRRDQGVQPWIGEQVERRRQSASPSPARPMRWRDLADLAGEEFEAAAMEGAAERDCDVAGAIPAHLEHRRL